MKRLTISVDDVATFRFLLKDGDFDPVQYALLCEVAGAHGIALTLTETQHGVQERDAQLIKQIHKTFLNLRIAPEPRSVKTALSINPDMVTFVDISRKEGPQISPLSSAVLGDTLSGVLADFHANSISVAVFCYPEINLLKQLSRFAIDYVEFDCTEITMAQDSNEQLVGYDKLSTAAMAAAKLGIGVNCFGGIGYGNLPDIAGISRIEDICMGIHILKRAMLVGIEKAVHEALQQIMFHQRPA